MSRLGVRLGSAACPAVSQSFLSPLYAGDEGEKRKGKTASPPSGLPGAMGRGAEVQRPAWGGEGRQDKGTAGHRAWPRGHGDAGAETAG